jgi:hypothetical protein
MNMKHKLRVPFSNLNFENWQNLILVALFFFYLSQFGFLFAKDSFLMGYGVDYLAYWSVGKIANDKSYADIYDLENLRSTQTQVLETRGILEKGGVSKISPFPAPIFSFFVLPFQLLSRFSPRQSYWLWTSLNLAVLIGYLIFFLRKTLPLNTPLSSAKQMLLLLLLSFPVIVSLIEGQDEVILVVCMGEFIRYALNKKPLPSGIWLGGLLLKPQLLIIIIPILIIQKNWKVLMGFFTSSGVIIGSSFILSGYNGMKSLIDLWTRFGAGIATNSPERMINWRMVALNLNSSLGWVIAILGMVLTLLAIYFLVKGNYVYGTSQWVMIMLGVFTATLAITWHSHYHMAVVLFPLLIYCCLSQMLSKKVVLFWAIVTPVILMTMTIITLFVFLLIKININDFGGILYGFSGFFTNLVVLISVLQYFQIKNKTPGIPSPGNPAV